MINHEKIKLVIWDLDETFWRGTISEESICVPKENEEILVHLLDAGVVHSICSKNDQEPVEKELKALGLWENFVFPSINWEPKGHRVKHIVDAMGLRPENVLFVDDNPLNLREAQHFSEGLMIAAPDKLESLRCYARRVPKKDKARKRLRQYQLLEKKKQESENYGSNEAFLSDCDIKVSIEKDCMPEIERLHELLMRANQLNYTKRRPSIESLSALLQRPGVDSGYVRVRDKFGEYGIVGFYVMEDHELLHFVFSCRTLGMKVEQYVYAHLGFPALEVSGEVVSLLSQTETPPWINQKNVDAHESKAQLQGSTLIKGPCDLLQIISFIKENDKIKTEFSYKNDQGVSVEGHNHTAQIVTALTLSTEGKKKILEDMPFSDPDMLSTSIEDTKYSTVILSMLTDGNLGIYRHKETGACVSFAEAHYPLTDPSNEAAYIAGDVFTSGVSFTKPMLERFRDRFEFVDNSDGARSIQNLDVIWNRMGQDTKLILMLGSEQDLVPPYKPTYRDRHLTHAAINRNVERWAIGKQNVVLLPFDKYIHSRMDFTNTINHFVKRVYYDVAKDLVDIISGADGGDAREMARKSYLSLLWETFRYEWLYFATGKLKRQ